MPTKKSLKKGGTNKPAKQSGGKKAKSYKLKGKNKKEFNLKCEVDHHDKFYKKNVTVNSGRMSSFLDLDWLFDKSAVMLICENCSTIKWIKNKKNLKSN